VTIPDRYTLITNLDYVIVGAVRTYTHALPSCTSMGSSTCI
jgi:hypothetical protein